MDDLSVRLIDACWLSYLRTADLACGGMDMVDSRIINIGISISPTISIVSSLTSFFATNVASSGVVIIDATIIVSLRTTATSFGKM